MEHGQPHHGHSHEHVDVVEANRQHHNEHSHTFINDLSLRTAELCANAIEDALPDLFDEDDPKSFVIDYACGPGLVAQELSSGTKVIVGVDISEKMVEDFNTRVYNQGISKEEMRAVLVKDLQSELKEQKADLVICCQAYHHFPDLEATTNELASLLKPGGKLVVVDLIRPEKLKEDLIAFDEKDQKLSHSVPHKRGFTLDGFKAILQTCNLLDEVTVEPAFELSYEEMMTLKPPAHWKRLEELGKKIGKIEWLIAIATRKA
ncbi:S-adenosyl-L-methionine-dependent methyltransferase [Atractiella rhizophila]|nr:S-adenosyl-L-methionine-dependent methyltransferase [Atractiella rhizophila]